MIYLDNSATTRPYPEVIDTFVTVSQKYFGNPSSIHGIGMEAEKLISQSRNRIASLLNVNQSEIVFTSGGTEGINLAIKGIAFKYQNRGKHCVTTKIEHPATIEAFQQLEDLGFSVTYLDVDHHGQISIEDVKKAIRDDTILVSIIHVNNELGTIQPIEQIGTLLNKYPKLFFHVDHVQGIGKVPLSFKKAGVDLCSMSGHKFHSVKGTGILYIRDGVSIMPLLAGGNQELKKRAGTENVPGIVSMTKALRLFIDQAESGNNHLQQLKSRLIEGLGKLEDVYINTPLHESAPHIVNISVMGVKPEVLIHSLEEKDIFVSTRSACSSKQDQPSHVLLATGMDQKRAVHSIRISMSFDNTETEIVSVLNIMQEKIPKLRQVMR